MSHFLNLQDNSIIQSPQNTYRLLCTLGQGGYGITYLAETTMKVTSIVKGELGEVKHTHDAKVKVALKEFFLKEVNGRDGTQVTCSQQQGYFQKYKEKFQVEAQNLSRLHHPNIVSVIEMFNANNTLYYSMEYIEGMSLQQYIAKYGPLSEQQMLPLIQTIGQALDYMHGQKMLHLDLKPNNIMLRNDMTPVIIDFGLSKHYQQNGVPESSTTIGAGTPGYAPIEQNDYHGGNGFPVTLDIYALGATMYKILTGTTPPVASSVMNDGLPLNSLVNRGISQRTIDVIVKAMAPMKGARYQSIAEMIYALTGNFQAFQANDESTSLASEGTVRTKFCPHCGGEILMDAQKCWHCGQWVGQPKPPKPPVPPKKGVNKGLIIAAVVAAAAVLMVLGWFLAGLLDQKKSDEQPIDSTEVVSPAEDVPEEIEDTPEVEEITLPEEPVVHKSILDNDESVYFEGVIGGKYEIKAFLQNDDDNLSGWIYYVTQGSKNKMSFQGYAYSRNNIELYEIHDGEIVGEITCSMRSDNSLHGTHTNYKGEIRSFEMYPL